MSIIIVSWNTRDLLAECLSALGGGGVEDPDQAICVCDGLRCEVLVVDNASHDGTAEMIRERFPWVRLLANHDNIGFARANNQGLRLSKARYVLLLNPDTRAQPGALRTMFDFSESHPSVGVVGARIVNADGTLQVSCYPAPTLPRELWRLFHLDALFPYASYPMARWDLDQARATDTVLGACMFVRRSALDELGLLDEDFFIYSEEVDLCERARQHAWAVYFVPQATVVHHGAQSTQQVAAKMFLHLYGAKVLYFRKHHGPLAASMYKLILGAAALVRLSLLPLTFVLPGQRRRRNSILAGHYWRLIRVLGSF